MLGHSDHLDVLRVLVWCVPTERVRWRRCEHSVVSRRHPEQVPLLVEKSSHPRNVVTTELVHQLRAKPTLKVVLDLEILNGFVSHVVVQDHSLLFALHRGIVEASQVPGH